MKKIIDRKLYDTEEAEVIATDERTIPRRTDLFVTKKANFFLCHWSRWKGEEDKIELLDQEQAWEFFRKNATTDQITNYKEKYFLSIELERI